MEEPAEGLGPGMIGGVFVESVWLDAPGVCCFGVATPDLIGFSFRGFAYCESSGDLRFYQQKRELGDCWWFWRFED